MISIDTGPPGNGKSLNVQSDTIAEYLFDQRDIVTSTPVRYHPWVTQDGRPMLGLIHYLRLAFKHVAPEPELVAPGITSMGRMLCVEDESELSTLFMWRRDKDTGKWFKIRWDVQSEQFDKSDLARVNCGALIITDEAWKCYSSRRWKDSEKVTEFYGRQHRKFGDDWHIVSHSHKDIDVQVNRMAQQWRVCTNYGLRRLSVFRQPPVFEIKTFYEPPNTQSARPMHTAIRRLDVRVAQTYDTSAGVAVGGGRAADVKRRKKGISMGWLVVGVVLIVVSLALIPKALGGGFRAYMDKALGVKPKMPATTAKPVVPPSTAQPMTPFGIGMDRVRPHVAPEPVAFVAITNELPPLRVTGHVFDGKRFRVLMSDGTTRTVRSGFNHNEDGSVTVDGKRFDVQKVEPGRALEAKDFSVSPPPAFVRTPEESSVSVTVIGDREPVPESTTMQDWKSRR